MADLIVYDSLGAPEDTASDTGSLHAKIAYLKSYVDTVISGLASSTTKNPRFTPYNGQPGPSSSVTLANVTGAGFLTGLQVFLNASAGNMVATRLVITIDGTSRLDTGSSGLTNFSGNATYQNAWISLTIPMIHRFASSFVINLYNEGTSGIDAKTQTAYVLD